MNRHDEASGGAAAEMRDRAAPAVDAGFHFACPAARATLGIALNGPSRKRRRAGLAATVARRFPPRGR